MNAKTQQALIDINRLFYSGGASGSTPGGASGDASGDASGRAGVADEFSNSRRDPWPGWRRALSHLGAPTGEPLSVLDVGCGNGRFARFLEDELGSSFRYLGLDSSPALIAHARVANDSRHHIEFTEREILDPAVDLVPAESRYGLIALFGVLHHVPAQASRRRLLERLLSHLARDGILVVTAWQFGAFERFRNRIVPWEKYNETSHDPIDERELEVGDHLLPWGSTSLHRYCHFTPPEELRELLPSDHTEQLEEYSADGKSGDLNHYLVVRRRRESNE